MKNKKIEYNDGETLFDKRCNSIQSWGWADDSLIRSDAKTSNFGVSSPSLFDKDIPREATNKDL